MNPKYLFFITLSTVFFYACKSSDNNLFYFDPRSTNENELSLSDIADNFTYVPLNNSFSIGNIRNITFLNHSIYFYSNEGIIVFDRVRNQLIKIGSKGRGPAEYLHYSNFTVDEKTGILYVLDQGDIVKTYSDSGHFLRSFPLQKYGSPASIDFFESKLFVSYAIQYGNAKYKWIVFDTIGNVIKKKESSIPIFNSIYGNANKPTYNLGNRIFYWNEYTDTVFKVLPDLTEEPSFIICPGEHRFPKLRSVPINPYEKYMVLHYIFETSRYIVISYYYKKPILLLFDKHNKESFLTYLEYDQENCLNGIVNDLDGGTMFVPVSCFSEKGREYMAGLIDPYKLKYHVKSKEFKNSTPEFPEKKKELEKLANSLKETDNPVLMIVRLKK